MNSYDDDEEGKRVALEELDNGTVNQKMWLKACVDTDISIGNTSKILYVKYRILQRKANFLADLLIREQRESKRISQDIWKMYDKQSRVSQLKRVDSTARRVFWVEFFLERLFKEKKQSSEKADSGLFERKQLLRLYFVRALTYVKGEPTNFINMGLLSIIFFLMIDTHHRAGQASAHSQNAQRYSYDAADYSRDARDFAREARTEAASANVNAKNAALLSSIR